MANIHTPAISIKLGVQKLFEKIFFTLFTLYEFFKYKIIDNVYMMVYIPNTFL